MKRIMHEVYCLYDIDMTLKTAENAVSNKLVSALMDSYIQEAIYGKTPEMLE